MTRLQSFRNEISNYNYYKREIRRLEEEISDYYYQLFGIRGVDPGKYNIENKNYIGREYQTLSNIERFDLYKEERIRQITRMRAQVEHIDSILNSFDKLTRSVFIEIYIENRSYVETCMDLKLMENGKPKIGELQYIMKKAFKED